MAEFTSARPQGATVRAQRLANGMHDASLVRSPLTAVFDNRLEIAAVCHLALLAAVEFKSSTGGATSILVLSGVVLVLLALMQNGGVFKEPQTTEYLNDDSPAALEIAAPLAGRMMSAHEIALERQSQRLVEIADSATRSKIQSELRSQVWADLTARVSHELRTPLNAVIGFTDLMRSEVMGPVGHPRYVEYLDHIHDSGRTLLKSAEDTLALTALLAAPGSSSVPEILDLGEFASEAWAFSSADAALRGITLAADGLIGLDIQSERRPLRQILINLYSSALARAADDSTITLSANSDGGVVEVVVSVSKIASDLPFDTGALSLNLARALLELQDTYLLEPPAPSGSWRAVTVFAAASQADFFA